MMIEVVPLDRCQRRSHLKTFHWLNASRGARTAAAVAAAIGYSSASPLVADEHDLHAEA